MHTKVVSTPVLLAAVIFSHSAAVRLSVDVSDREVADWVRSHIDSLQPTPQEKRFDEIGWAKSIVEAEQLARRYNRPIFLFTHDGRIALGRC